MAEEAHTAKAVQMPGMPAMLAYTIRAPIQAGQTPYIRIGQGPSSQIVTPGQASSDNSYWIVILDANKPASKVQELVIPWQNNAVAPTNLNQNMSNPGYFFAVVTRVLSNSSVPQGPFYDWLVAHGAGRELQKLEQISSHTQTGYGIFSTVSYILTGQCGPTINVAYECSSWSEPALLLMSLMPLPSGPPYSICDTYTFVH